MNKPTDAMPDRIVALHEWLSNQLNGATFTLAPASSDASFRRYFRISFDDGRPSLIVMDAPPDKENCKPFVDIGRLFAAAGVHVPEIIAENLAEGFLLLSDLGNATYLSELNERSADALYRDAISALITIQKASKPGILPVYDRALLKRELDLFPEWYIARQLGKQLTPAQSETLSAGFERILDNNLAQAQVYVHRDYHSRNLMIASPNPGILDFQDAVYGPITYDLVSLLRDAYISWEEQQVLDWCIRYWEAARKAGLPVNADFADFYRDFEWMGAQRQIKVLGIFARLCHRDGKDAYLKDQPLVMSYLRKTCHRYRELGPLEKLLNELVPVDTRTGYTF
jgi:aminoglycoside/choline kinase family phosphotransferase